LDETVFYFCCSRQRNDPTAIFGFLVLVVDDEADDAVPD